MSTAFEGSRDQQVLRTALEAMTPEQRDRIVRARKIATGKEWYDGECGCLIGTAYTDHPERYSDFDERYLFVGDWPEGFSPWFARPALWGAGIDFPDICELHTPEVVIGWCKAECARLNGTAPEDIQALVGSESAVAEIDRSMVVP